MPQLPDPTCDSPRRSWRLLFLMVVPLLGLILGSTRAVDATAAPEDSPQPRPVPAREIDPPAPSAISSATSSSMPSATSSSTSSAPHTGGWIAFAGGSESEAAKREAAGLLRQWAASAAPALPPVEERLSSGAVKLHHRGHYLSTLVATIDEQGRLRYHHEPPADHESSRDLPSTADPAAVEGGEGSAAARTDGSRGGSR
jgi:hypothetical protein